MLSVEAGVLSMFVLELVKLFIRRVILQNPEYDFPALYYTLMIPFLTALIGFGLGAIGWAEPVVLEWSAVAQWAVAIVVQLVAYHMGIQPLKEYSRLMAEE